MVKYMFIIFFAALSCRADNSVIPTSKEESKEIEISDDDQLSKVEDIELPIGFERAQYSDQEFGSFLRSIFLKPNGSPVMYYNGQQKSNDVHFAVLDLGIGNKDLHQCADATMRLRADYLRSVDRDAEISFNFTNGFPCIL